MVNEAFIIALAAALLVCDWVVVSFYNSLAAGRLEWGVARAWNQP